MQAAKIEFWYEFASTYSYLSAMRIGDAAAASGVDVIYKPFLLGPIFRDQGWVTSPFNIYPAKGRYMWRDLGRLAAARGLPFRRPSLFPQNGLHAARVALVGAEEGWIGAFTRRIYQAEFECGDDIANIETLKRVLHEVAPNGDAENVLFRAQSLAIKDRLRCQCDLARRIGIFGAPTFRVARGEAGGDGEIFWGDDRLDAAVDWAVANG